MSVRRRSKFCYLILVLVASSTQHSLAQPEHPANPYTHAICVKHFHKIALSEAEVDSILAKANALLTAAATSTLECKNLLLKREGPIVSFTTEYSERINDEAAFTKITSDSCVKVVRRISWCGGPVQAGGALGCAPVKGTGFAV